ncbi:Transcriptional activator protein acu-15 OS=Neurospora crassa (strain ATCC 24698 / 74-OR23-1A / CBS 708,71 / DSM 1257 / FGSC 987) GN=acu-15 PE=1 SV=2 [Rhizoctonia solani AG-1 IB]|uniref:Transcriptional activator protein acu-15 n=1 Tax=Thanatephorus cucumeris (strain AG1-IB / isolate 7/3/14) TaxID=1108050 RepID=A0A0B7F3Q1_THACB|nr:Transcriptional activator protein acu-15 OS=Neurospora crassa (strain ATCC 24698 / 74-OR23-1A / CBS 708,71 / DSM 1257 / FGSC 987) GN=acu-15 PE=1 SV=2 [Rhizoctonia solani AG-1 IB]
MSVASAPVMSSSEDHRSLPPFSNFIALSSRPPLHPHSNSFSDPRLSLAPVPSSPDRDQKGVVRPSISGSTRASPPGLDRANSIGKGSAGRADESGPANDDPDRPKRKRQSQSCDACRARKVRCARENPEDQTSSCKHCQALDIPCTYDYQPKKRGPPNLYLRRLQEAAAANLAAQQVAAATGSTAQTPGANTPQTPALSVGGIPATDGISPAPLSSVSPHQQHGRAPISVPSQPTVPSSANEQPAHVPLTLSTGSSSLMEYNAPLSASSLPVNLPPSRYPIAADQFQPPGYGHGGQSPGAASEGGSEGRPQTADATSQAHLEASFPNNYPLYNWTMPYKNNGYGNSHPPGMSLLPPLSYFYRPHRLDDVAPRERIMHIIGVFFDLVYPLTPCIHRPSFMADLANRREERDPLFFALVMSTVASTLVQAPRSYIPMDRPSVRRLAQQCHEASRHITVTSYDPPTSMMVVIRYFDTCYHFCEGHDATSHAAFGEAAHIAVTLHMHEEASYEGLDPIECEIRRRTFWLLFGADKSMSILLGRPICLRDEDCTLHFPKEVDDEYITLTGIQPQPHGKTAIVSGLNYISRIFALLGEILVRIRVDKRSPPQGPFATARLEEVRSLHTRISSALMHAPPALRLKPNPGRHGSKGLGYSSMAGQQDEYGGAGFRKAAFAEVKDFFDNPNASRANATNPYLVMQANLYVTQQLVRYVIEQYRDELVTSMRQNSTDNFDADLLRNSEDREQIAIDLLNVLHSIPIQSIATNGPSLVHKVRFVASTLLDAVRKAETAPASAARAHAYLWDFLSILSEIERNYLLDDDHDGGLSDHPGAINV